VRAETHGENEIRGKNEHENQLQARDHPKPNKGKIEQAAVLASRNHDRGEVYSRNSITGAQICAAQVSLGYKSSAGKASKKRRKRNLFGDQALAHRRKNNRAAAGKNFQIGESTSQLRMEDGKANPRAGASRSEDLANRD
jgi:hypothetical protein